MSVSFLQAQKRKVRITLDMEVFEDFNPKDIDFEKLFDLEPSEKVDAYIEEFDGYYHKIFGWFGGLTETPQNPYIAFVTHHGTLMTTISLTSGELLDLMSVLCDKEQSVYEENPHLSAYYLNIMQQFEEVVHKLNELPGEKRVANLILAMGHLKNWHRALPNRLNSPYTDFVTHHGNLMGTRSRIGYELSDGSVVSSYCQYDGYLEGNGRVLVTHYQNREDIKELIDGGSMSSIRTRETWNSGPSLKDEKKEYIRDSEGYIMYENDREPQPLYHRERGDGEDPMHSDFDTFVAGNSCEEYAYLYDLNGNWKAYKIGWSEEPTQELKILGLALAV